MAGEGETCYHWSMRNLRKIFERLGFYNRSPSLELKDLHTRLAAATNISSDDRVLLSKILDAVIAIADDDAEKASKKATKEG